MSDPVELRFGGFEAIDPWTLRATFDCRDLDGRRFTAYVELGRDGRIRDLQASDTTLGATTGRPAIDSMISRRVDAELTRARSAAVVADFDRRGRRRYG